MPAPFDIAKLPLETMPELARLAGEDAVEALRFDDGEVMIQEGDPSREILLVLKGAYVVEHQRHADSEAATDKVAAVMSDLHNPSFAGEMAYLGGAARSATVRSSGATLALRLEPGHLDLIMSDFPWLTRVLCRQFTARLRETSEIMEQYLQDTYLSAEQVCAKPGQVLFAAGDEASVLYQLIDGRVELLHDSTVEEVRPDGSEGHFLEPEPFFAGAPHRKTARAATGAVLISVPAEARTAMVRRYPELCLSLLAQAYRA
jgi:CRP-like cAMP-binding protein